MTFAELQRSVGEWSHKNRLDGEEYYALLGLAEEVGELAHAFLKMKQRIRGTTEQHRADMVDAIGDIAVYLAGFCARNDIDLNAAVEKTWDKVERRDWLRFPQDGVSS